MKGLKSILKLFSSTHETWTIDISSNISPHLEPFPQQQLICGSETTSVSSGATAGVSNRSASLTLPDDLRSCANVIAHEEKPNGRIRLSAKSLNVWQSAQLRVKNQNQNANYRFISRARLKITSDFSHYTTKLMNEREIINDIYTQINVTEERVWSETRHVKPARRGKSQRRRSLMQSKEKTTIYK